MEYKKQGMIALLFLFVVLPLSDSVISQVSETLPERVASLEEFRQQQRDWNTWMDNHSSIHADNLARSQGAQDDHVSKLDERIRQLENRDSNLTMLGGLGALLLAVLFPLAWYAYSTKHQSLMKRVKVLEGIAIKGGHVVSPEVD